MNKINEKGTAMVSRDNVISAIIIAKYKKNLGEEFVDAYECNYVTHALQQRFNKDKVDAVITNSINSDLYKDVNGLYFMNENHDTSYESILANMGFVDNINVYNYLMNANYIFSLVREAKQEKILNELNSKPKSLIKTR